MDETQLRLLSGRVLRALRQQAGLSQRELGECVGRNEVAISIIETGRDYVPEEWIEPFARALACEPAELEVMLLYRHVGTLTRNK